MASAGATMGFALEPILRRPLALSRDRGHRERSLPPLDCRDPATGPLGKRMDKRIASGCIASIVGLMLFAFVGYMLGAKLQQVVTTPMGELALFDLAGMFVSMAAGGAIAGRRFVWFAIALVALIWIPTIYMLVAMQPEMTLARVLRFNRLAIGANLVLAVLGTFLGAWIAERLRGRHAVA